ncbi:MAG: 6,7-dimethyl-8-ribityllumazine synthase [Gammaproteobacteria bacterium]|nr:6,7-dimethyl-8-ribityllumazine synthase [Gammaproteobacteria bacterium]
MSTQLAIVISEFNQPITERLLQGALAQLQHYQLAPDTTPIIRVPGAIEIPFAIQQLLEHAHYDAVIALGAVIRGETSHYDSVCQQISYGCQRLILDYQTPIIFGILTTDNAKQAYARSGGEHSNKGSEAVDSAMRMIKAVQDIAMLTDPITSC